MPVKSLSKTHKKRASKNPVKSSTAKRFKKMSRKCGKKRGGGPKTKSKSKTAKKEDEMPDDLPLPIHHAEQGKEDIEYFENIIEEFYNKRKDIQDLKAKPTDTREQREDKKTTFADFPSSIEDHIFEEKKKQMQPELDNYDKKKIKRDKAFEKIIAKLGREQDNDPDIYMYYHNKINEAHNLWKPEEDSSNVVDGYPVWAPEHNPRSDIEEEHDMRLGALRNYIGIKWDVSREYSDTNRGWRTAVDEYNPESGRKLTDILVEDFSIPGVVADSYGECDNYGDTTADTDNIDDWNNAWRKANIAEYRGSAEEEKDIKDQMKKTKKDRTSVVAEFNKTIEAEEKIRADAEEKEKRKCAAAADKIKKDEEAANRPSRKEVIRQRMKAKFADEVAKRNAAKPKKLRIQPSAEKVSASVMQSLPSTTPAPAQKVSASVMQSLPITTPAPAPAAKVSASVMPPQPPATISRAEAEELAKTHDLITINTSSKPPGHESHGHKYMHDGTTGEATWIVDEHAIHRTEVEHEIHRTDAVSAVQNNPAIFSISTEGETSYITNTETGVRARIIEDDI